MPQRLYFMRHGERADNVWKTFVDLSFDSEGNYTPNDVNFPKEIPKRTDGYKNFAMDPPLTEVGVFTSTLLGREYRDKGIKIHRVYSSPPLRCVQTASAFIKGYGEDVELCIETGLFEYMTHKVYEKGHPSWMTLQDFKDAGYNIKETEQIIKGDELRYGESYNELYNRSHRMVKGLLERHPDENLLCIGHGITMECCTRLLTGKHPRSDEHRLHILLHSSYCANLEVVGNEDGTFEITGCPVRQLKVSPVDVFDSSVYFLNEEEIEEDIKKKVDLYRKYKAILK